MKQKTTYTFISALIIFTFALILLAPSVSKCQPSKARTSKRPRKVSIKVACPIFLKTCARILAKEFKKIKPFTTVILVDSIESKLIDEQASEPEVSFTVRSKSLKSKKNKSKKSENEKVFLGLGRTAMVIYVNRKNPLKGLTIPQIDAIFSQNRKCGFPFEVTGFGQLGLTGSWIDTPIEPLGTAAFPKIVRWFEQMCLCNGMLKQDVKLLATKTDLIRAISSQKRTIGFHTLIKDEKGIRAVAISRKEGDDYFLPTYANIRSGLYPLIGMIGIEYTENIGKEALEFVRFCLTKKAKKILLTCGPIPIFPSGYKTKELNSKKKAATP